MAQSMARQRVAIAGTVTNQATGEGIPHVVVRISHAPSPFVAMLMDSIQAVVNERPDLSDSYQHLFQGRPITADTLRTAQILLDAFERNDWLVAPRPDQTTTGFDGHYCFFDLNPGEYRLTATLTTPNFGHGITQGGVYVLESELRFAFSELDLTMAVESSPMVSPTSLNHTNRRPDWAVGSVALR